MKVTATDHFTVEHAAELYGLAGWGNGYLSIGENGHLMLRPAREGTGGIDVYDVIQQLAQRGFADATHYA